MNFLRFKSLRDIEPEEGTVKLVDGIVPFVLILTCDADLHQFKDVENKDIVLVPQPSDDVNDPLNWPKWKKSVAFLTVVFYAFLASWVLGGINLGIPGIIVELKADLNQAVNGLISWPVLTLGIAVILILIQFSDFKEFYFGSCSTLYWQTTRFHFRVIAPVCVDYLGRQSQEFWQFGGCSRRQCYCCYRWGGAYCCY